MKRQTLLRGLINKSSVLTSSMILLSVVSVFAIPMEICDTPRMHCIDSDWDRNFSDLSIECSGIVTTEDANFCAGDITIVQNGRQYSLMIDDTWLDEYHALMECDGVQYCCGTLKYGVQFSGKITSFPPSFNLSDSFRLYYSDDYIDFSNAGEPTTTIASSSTTTTIVEQECPVNEIYGEHSAKTQLIRYFRDNILHKTAEGQELIRLYYQWGPIIVKAMEEDEEFKGTIKELIDSVLIIIQSEME